MKRRKFFTTTAAGIGAGTLAATNAQGAVPTNEKGERLTDKWTQVGTGTTGLPNRKKKMTVDVAVIGGGMSGISAAVAAARNGAKTVLVQDRPVLGGNASSEMRVTVNGANSRKRPSRETGIIEEILIENRYYNQQESYPVWDHVLYDYVTRQPNLELMLNTQAVEAIMDGKRIQSAVCWQSTSETEFVITAKEFVDCSGDGLLAACAGAEYRTGREGRDEFGESFAPEKPDGWTMGDTILMMTKKMDKPVPFRPPSYAIPFDHVKAAQTGKHSRIVKQVVEGFWWVEVGSDFDIIADREVNRHKLMAYFYGIWDYVKNSGDFPEAENIALDWIGSIPGRRESRRFMGDHILTQVDIQENRHFEDAVAYGGWGFDEHCPGGIENLDDPPSFFYGRVPYVYEIPYRSLYSRNISNLQFAGRNVSVTHTALSSTRIIATCSMMGQAAGTAAAICVQKGITPRTLAANHINELQEQLLRDDVFIPNRPASDEKDLARKADGIFASSTISGDAKLLIDGISRDEPETVHHWESDGLNAEIHLEWERPVQVAAVELKGDTNIGRNMQMYKQPDKGAEQIKDVPPELVKNLTCEARVQGKWVEVAAVEDNMTRLVKMKFNPVKATAIRLKLKETWGHKTIKLFEVRCYESA
ncbi:FAD-dependent oxidoreductase [Pontiella sulfatireligans]|uniref:tRNA uridine 5-carboxymethylaminomethyl modification enzyme MnmG n=1 Tax=Pontiella sulfatireligans TaxID=2750658 RepID=A0A6C2UDS0_9BACT|nr:FAD-dependent oxidoreductase [Pontiella sulfatireligans]VGO18310.1 hypothetical protein SCARR_00362 [Pontiella sulfatireligans]